MIAPNKLLEHISAEAAEADRGVPLAQESLQH